MKKTLITLLTLAGVSFGENITIEPNTPCTLDTSITYRLDFRFNETEATAFEVITTGDQTITGTDGYNIGGAANATITFTLGGKLTADASYKKFGEKFANGVTINMNMGLNGSFYSPNSAITLVGFNSKLNLTTETNLNQCSTGISTRELIGIGQEKGSQGSIWYSVNNGTTSLTLKDKSLDDAGFINVGVLCLTSDGTYTNLAGEAVVLGDNQYGMLFTRSDFSYYNNATESVSLIINKAVPEPTTATLSLLALAGLAARRRRK